jgi:hypothetical protein
MNRTQLINSLIREHNYKTYIEIGLGDSVNFNAINCDNKIGVDPKINTDSDTFFQEYKGRADIIFIDGLHHSDQVERDILNSWRCLNRGGMMLIHDIKPHDYDMTIVPRQQSVWTGDVFKAWYGFIQTYSRLNLGYIDDEYGLGFIIKSNHRIKEGFVSDITFQEYKKIEGWKPK